MIGFFSPGYAAGSVDGVVAVKYFDRGTDGDMGYFFVLSLEKSMANV